MNPITRTVNLVNSNATNIASLQTTAGAANLVLNALASAIDTSGAGRIVLFTTTENDSAVNYTIVGLDANGNSITEGPIALPSSTTKASTLAYASISSIHVSGAIASNISVGTTNTTKSAIDKLIALDFYNRVAPQVVIEVTGTINFTVNETFDPIMAGTVTANNAIMFAPTALASKTANTNSVLDVGATGVQVQINSYSSGATLTMRVIHSSNDNNG